MRRKFVNALIMEIRERVWDIVASVCARKEYGTLVDVQGFGEGVYLIISEVRSM